MPQPVVYGAAYSVYVQALRLTLWAKGVAYDLVEVDAWTEGKQLEHLARHPFGRIPAFRHGALQLHETAAICRYVDEAWPGPALQPATAAARAKMALAIAILDNYGYQALVWDTYVQEVGAPERGRPSDPKRLAEGRRQAPICLRSLEALADGPWLAGDELSLADCHAAPMFNLFLKAPGGLQMMRAAPRLTAWWDRVSAAFLPAEVMTP